MRVPARSGEILALLLGLGFAAGCSGNPDALAPAQSDGDDIAVDPARLETDFMAAYETGFAEGNEALRRDAQQTPHARTGSSETDRDFIAGYAQLTSVPLRDVEAFVESGEADALLQSRYRQGGLNPDGLVPANVLLFISAWEAYSGQDASPEQIHGVHEQMQAGWNKSQAFELSTEGRRQRRLFELLAAVLMREDRRIRQSGDASESGLFRSTVREDFLRHTHNDLARLDLTADGLIER